MDRVQKRQERKKKRREKIRKEHLVKLGQDHKQVIYQDLTRGQFVLPKETLPTKDDMHGWYRVNQVTDKKKLFKKVIEMYKEDRTLRRYLDGKIGQQEKEAINTLDIMFSKAIQALHCDPPYFIPIILMREYAGYIRPLLNLFYLKRINTKQGIRWYDPYNEIKIDSKLVIMSTHTIDRIMERLNPLTNKFAANTIMVALFSNIQAGKLAAVNGEPILPLHNGTERLRKFYGMEEPFGYCPLILDDSYYVAPTFLLPGQSGTPERNILKIGGKNVDISNIADLVQNKKEFEEAGINLFFDDAERMAQK